MLSKGPLGPNGQGPPIQRRSDAHQRTGLRRQQPWRRLHHPVRACRHSRSRRDLLLTARRSRQRAGPRRCGGAARPSRRRSRKGTPQTAWAQDEGWLFLGSVKRRRPEGRRTGLNPACRCSNHQPMTTKKMNPDEDYEFYARPENQVPTSDRCFGMRRAAEPGTGHRAPGTSTRFYGRSRTTSQPGTTEYCSSGRSARRSETPRNSRFWW